MGRILIWAIFTLCVSLKAFGSGCGDDNYLQEMRELDVGSVYLSEPELALVGRRLHLTSKGGDLIQFRSISEGGKISKELLRLLTRAIEGQSYRVVGLNRKNVLFSYINDCDGLLFEASGKYELDIEVKGKRFTFIYPTIVDAIDWRQGEDKIIPLFKY